MRPAKVPASAKVEAGTLIFAVTEEAVEVRHGCQNVGGDERGDDDRAEQVANVYDGYTVRAAEQAVIGIDASNLDR